jgi:hypothetical protein
LLSLFFVVILYVMDSQATLYEIENPKWVLSMGAFILLHPIFNGMFILLVHGERRGEPLTLSQALTRILPCYGQLVAGEIMVNLGVLIGFLLLFVPGAYLGLRLIFYKQAIVIDGASAIAGMRTSLAMTQDWHDLVVLLRFLAILYAPTFLVVGAIIALPLGSIGNWVARAVSVLTFAWVNTLLTDLYVPHEKEAVMSDEAR